MFSRKGHTEKHTYLHRLPVGKLRLQRRFPMIRFADVVKTTRYTTELIV